MGEWEVAVPLVPALISLALSVLVYRRQRRNDDSIGWVIDQGGKQVHLVRTGGGTAHDVDVTVGGGATRLAWHQDHHDVVKSGSRISVGTFAPSSAYQAPGEISVTWTVRGALGRRKPDSWTSHIL